MTWGDPVTGTEESEPVTLDDLGLEPIDMLGLIRTADDQAMTELDDRIVRRVLAVRAPRPDAALEIAYMDGGAGLSVFEAAPAVAHARALASRARPLRPTDIQPPGTARERDDATARIDRGRVAAVLTTAEDLASEIATFLATRPASVDDAVTDAVALLERGAQLGIPGSGWGFAYEGRRRRYAEVVARLRDVAAAWTRRLNDVDDRLAAYDALPAGTPDDERLAELARIESELLLVLPDPPATPAAGRTRLTAERDAFEARRDELLAIADGTIDALSDVLDAVAALGSLEPYDTVDVGVETAEQDAERLVSDVVAAVRGARRPARRPRHGRRLTRSPRTTPRRTPRRAWRRSRPAPRRCSASTSRSFPSSRSGPSTAPPGRTRSARTCCSICATTSADRFALDEWLYGVARVRTPLAHLEQVAILAEAFGRGVPALDPAQLPHRAGERWLALEYPATKAIDGERLLYTAQLRRAVRPGGARSAALLLDEWTEVIPRPAATTGIAIHFDQPSCEAPQALLLVTPATWDGRWQWADLSARCPTRSARAPARRRAGAGGRDRVRAVPARHASPP